MGASSSSNSGSLEGGNWGSRVYFDARADEDSNENHNYIFTEEQLRHEMRRRIDDNESIINIYVFCCKLFKRQLTKLILNHQFVVLETPSWWWSIEKNSEGITIQRSRELVYVKDKYRKCERPRAIERMSFDAGKKKMKDLIEFLFYNDEVLKTYHWINENSKDFAKRIYDNFADSEIHKTISYFTDQQVDVSGEKYKGRPYFYSYSDCPVRYRQHIDEQIFRNELGINDNETIQNIRSYELFCCVGQNAIHLCNFLVLQTSHYWLSVEKNTDGITIQKSESLNDVKALYRGRERSTPPTEINSGRSESRMRDLADSLFLKNVLDETYLWENESPSGFADRLFRQFSLN